MPTGNEWHHLHGIFQENAPALLARADECVAHLELIDNDSDAVEALLNTLYAIATLANNAQLPAIGAFSLRVNETLRPVCTNGRLTPAALASLRKCLALLAWQVELVDPVTGLLPLDDTEQRELLARLASDLDEPDPHQAVGYCQCPRGSAYALRLPEQR